MEKEKSEKEKHEEYILKRLEEIEKETQELQRIIDKLGIQE
jgi:hypothetical protein